MVNQDEEENNENFKLVIIILVSSILGGLLSIYISNMYNQNSELIHNLELKTIYAIGVQGVVYLFYIGISLFIAWVVIKLFIFSINILVHPINAFMNLFAKEEDDKKSKEYDLIKLYNLNSDFFNYIIILCFVVWLIIKKFDYIYNLFSVNQILVGIIIIVFYETYYLIRFIKKQG